MIPEQNGRHFADGNFKIIFLTEKFGILIEISMEFLRPGPVDYKSTLVQLMAITNVDPGHISSHFSGCCPRRPQYVPSVQEHSYKAMLHSSQGPDCQHNCPQTL